MNDRIIKIALDAGLLNYVDNETPRRYFINGNADIEEVEDFANNIISGITDLIDIAGKSRKYLSAEAVSREIKLHFGVE